MYKTMEQKQIAEQEVNLELMKEYSNEQLIDFAVAKNRKMLLAKSELEVIKAEIQSRGEQVIDDKNIKYTEFFSKNGIASVTLAQSMDILNIYKLKELLGKEFVEEKIKIKQQDVKYEVEDKFKKAIIAMITEDYTKDYTIDKVIEESEWALEHRQKELLKKKLKGDYASDRKTIFAILGKKEGELNVDVELYFIYKIKNWELIKAYFEEDAIDDMVEKVKRCIMVDETPKIGLKSS